mgnify:CR=1 FL=1|jgi:hypothetical protein
MSKVFFSGVVLSERAPLSVSEIRSQVMGPDDKTIVTLALNIWNNQITVVVESDEPNLFTLRNIVRSEAEFVTNVAGFILGYGYDVEITKAFGEALDPTRVFGIDIPVLSERVKGRDVNAQVNAIFPLCFGRDAIYLRRCLADLSFAIKRPDDTAFYCFRALESVRQSFGADLPEADQWKAMGEAVGSSKSDMEPLRTHAFPARHGIPKPTSEEERKALFLYTWEIVERYIDFRLGASGNAPVFSLPGKGNRAD